tara:strand:+ start:2863 stop:4158 length:1296 start_codon:yes stop_codon:yes gene_type:complete
MNKASVSWVYIAIALSAILAAILWSTGWAVAAGLCAIWFYQTHKLKQLTGWLNSNDKQAELPDAQGVWGRVFDQITELQIKHFKSEQELTTAILRIQKTANALGEGVVTVDASGALEWWNIAARKMLGLKNKQDRGAPLLHFLRKPEFFSYYQKADFTHPVCVQSPVQAEQTLEIAVTEFAKGDRLLIIRDITDSQKLERMRQDFIGNVSHELRTPLTVIHGYLETFQLHHPELDAPIQKAHMRMLAQTQRMTNLVQDLLLLSRLEGRNSQPEVVHNDMAVMLKQACEEAQVSAAKLNKQLTINRHLKSRNRVMGAKEEIYSVLINLVLNAVKYTQNGGNIDITWHDTDNGLCLTVLDDGIGIGQEHLSRLTERFYRVDLSRASASGGTGLGLAIAKRIMLRHKGSLNITSQEGLGSCFTCIFPSQGKGLH